MAAACLDCTGKKYALKKLAKSALSCTCTGCFSSGKSEICSSVNTFTSAPQVPLPPRLLLPPLPLPPLGLWWPTSMGRVAVARTCSMVAPGARAWRRPLHLAARKLVAPQQVHSHAANDASNPAAAAAPAIAGEEGDGDDDDDGSADAHPAPGVSLLLPLPPLLPFWLLLVVVPAARSSLLGLSGELPAAFAGVASPENGAPGGMGLGLGLGGVAGEGGCIGGGRREGPKKPSSPQSLVWQAHAAWWLASGSKGRTQCLQRGATLRLGLKMT